MADNFPPFSFTTQESLYGELSFKSAEDKAPLPLTGRQFEMWITPNTSGSRLIEPEIVLTMAEGRGLSLKVGDDSTLVFRVPKEVANGFSHRGEFTADILEVVNGERYLFMPVRLTYAEPGSLRAFMTRFLAATVTFASRQQPIFTPLAVPGREGRPGATIIQGLVPPVPADGKDSDFYIEDRTASGRGRRMYGPKANGVWPGNPWTIEVAAYTDIPGLANAIKNTGQEAAAQTAPVRKNILTTAFAVVLTAFTTCGYNNVGDSGSGVRYVRSTNPEDPGFERDALNNGWAIDLRAMGRSMPDYFGGLVGTTINSSVALDTADLWANKLGIGMELFGGTYWSTGSGFRGGCTWRCPYGISEIKCLPNTRARVIGREPPTGENLVPLVYSIASVTERIVDLEDENEPEVYRVLAFSDRQGSGRIHAGVHNFRIDGLHINGNRQVGGKCHGLGIYGSVFEISNCFFRNCEGVGRWTEYPFGDYPAPAKNAQSQFRNCYMLENKYGYRYGGPNDAEFYSDYPYLNDLINAHHYGAGTGKILFGHPWTDAPPGPQAKIGYLFDSPGNMMDCCAPEGAKEVQIWCRAYHQKLNNIYTFYNQLPQAGDNVVGIRVGDNGTSPDYLPGPRRAAAPSGFNVITGTIQGFNTAVQFQSDGGYNRIVLDGYTPSIRANPRAMEGSQLLNAKGNPLNYLHIRFFPTNEVGTPQTPVIPPFLQIPDRVDFFEGIRVMSGASGFGVESPQVSVDLAGQQWHRENSASGGLVKRYFASGSYVEEVTGLDGLPRDYTLRAWGAAQIRATITGLQFTAAQMQSPKAAKTAALPDKTLYQRPDGTLSVSNSNSNLHDWMAWKNLLHNARFLINKRGYQFTALAAGAYGLDRWRAGTAGCSMTNGGGAPNRSLNITAGSLIQTIEGRDVLGGDYVISWGGSALGRVAAGALPAGAYATSPLRLTNVPAGATITVEFGTGGLVEPQVELGSVPTLFEMNRPLHIEEQMCSRFYQNLGAWSGSTQEGDGSTAFVFGTLRVPMRINPVLTLSKPDGLVSRPNVANVTPTSIRFSAIDTEGGYVAFAIPTQPAGVIVSLTRADGVTLSADL